MRYVFDTMIIIYTVVQLFGITVQILVQIILPRYAQILQTATRIDGSKYITSKACL